MSASLRKRIIKMEASCVEGSTDRPTVIELWCYHLQYVVSGIALNPSKKTEPDKGYDHHWLYAHRDILRTEEDVRKASDDVLLESLGLAPVDRWGWLQFMVRDLNWFMLLASNWGLPGLRGEYGGNSNAAQYADVQDCRAQAALYFLELMRSRGCDPLAQARGLADKIKSRFERMKGRSLTEKDFTAWLRQRNELAYFVYTAESNSVRPSAMGPPGKVQYSGEYRAHLLKQIRNAAACRH